MEAWPPATAPATDPPAGLAGAAGPAAATAAATPQGVLAPSPSGCSEPAAGQEGQEGQEGGQGEDHEAPTVEGGTWLGWSWSASDLLFMIRRQR